VWFQARAATPSYLYVFLAPICLVRSTDRDLRPAYIVAPDYALRFYTALVTNLELKSTQRMV
jgi:hypothetical protein